MPKYSRSFVGQCRTLPRRRNSAELRGSQLIQSQTFEYHQLIWLLLTVNRSPCTDVLNHCPNIQIHTSWRRKHHCFGIPKKVGDHQVKSQETLCDSVVYLSILYLHMYAKIKWCHQWIHACCMYVCMYLICWTCKTIQASNTKESSGTLGIQVACSANKATRNRWQNVEKARSLAPIKDHTCKSHPRTSTQIKNFLLVEEFVDTAENLDGF